MVYVNTLLVQKVLEEKEWLSKMQPEDFRGLTPLFYGHVNPYGRLLLNMQERIITEYVAAGDSNVVTGPICNYSIKTLKYEEVYLWEYESFDEAYKNIKKFLEVVYNKKTGSFIYRVCHS